MHLLTDDCARSSGWGCDCRHFSRDCLSHIPGSGIPADVWSKGIAPRDYPENRLFDRMGCLLFAQMFQHHCARPYLRYRIGNSFAGNVRS